MTYLFIYRYSETLGGIQEIIKQVAKYLVNKQGAKVFVISDHPDYKHIRQKKYPDFEVHYYFQASTISFVRTHKIDSICVFDTNPRFVYLALLFKLLHKSVITNLTFCGSRSEAINPRVRWILRHFGKVFNNYLAISNYAKSKVVEQTKLKNIHVTYIPVDIDQITKSKLENYRIITIGRITPRKNYQDMLEAFKLIHAKFPSATLDIIGGLEPNKFGYYNDEIQDQVAQLGLEGSVKFWIDATSKKKYELLAQANVYITTAIHEMFGITTVEAFAAGLPVVGYDNTATAELMRLAGGIPVHDSESMAQKVIQLFDDPNKLGSLSKKSLKAAQIFEADKIAAKYANIISSVK